jgi:hypothetical protein
LDSPESHATQQVPVYTAVLHSSKLWQAEQCIAAMRISV